MKAKIGFVLCAVLLASSMAFAVNGTGFYTLIGDGANFYLKQEPKQSKEGLIPGPAGAGRSVIMSVPDSLGGLNAIFSKWTESLYDTPLKLETDIDLGQIDSSGNGCVVSHTPLPYSTKKFSPYFYGQGKKIKNLCISVDEMTGPMGFFETIESGNIDSLIFDDVRIKVNGISSKGEDYYPVGALAGKIRMAAVNGVKISNVSIDAPFAGGLAGIIDNSTLNRVTATDNISIVNSVEITEGYAGSKYMSKESDAEVNGSNYGYNVFLGGLVGVSVRSRDENDDASFIGDVVSAKVRNVPVANNSALGGVAGLMVANQDFIKNVKVKSVGDSKSEISGGSAMGGLVGFVANVFENNTALQGISIDSSSFDGKISDASVGGIERSGGESEQLIYVGGLVGRDSVENQSWLIIKNSQANLDLKDSMTVVGKYYYRAGGILGGGNRCGGNVSDSLYVTINNSKTTGNMQIAGSGKPGLHMQTFVGGIAGDVCLASHSRSFNSDSSSMNINVNPKTSCGDLLLYTVSVVFDTVVVGGMIGNLNTASTEPVTLNDIRFEGSIKVADSLNTVIVGGTVGRFPAIVGGSSIGFRNTLSRADTLIKLDIANAAIPSNAMNDKMVAKIGGVCGYCRELSEIEKTAVVGNIVAKGTFAGDSLLVGGVVAESQNTTIETRISAVFNSGDILADVAMKETGVKKVGYIAAEKAQGKVYKVKSSYHYGENDLDVGPFGGQQPTEGTWLTDAKYVVRNGDARVVDVNNNGTMIKQTMRSTAFAGILNSAFDGTATDPYVWASESDYNGDLPFFTHDGYAPVGPADVTTYSVSFWGMDKTLIGSVQKVKEGGAAVAPEAPEIEGYTFKNWDKAFDVIKSDLNVNAVYAIDTFTVIFETEDGSVISGPQKVTYGGEAVEPNYRSIPEKEGYTLVGWSDSSFLNVKSDLKIYPVYEINTYELTYLYDADSILDVIDVEFGARLELKEPIEKPATNEFVYTFNKWVTEDGSEAPLTMPASDLALMAKFDSIQNFTVVFLNHEGDTLITYILPYGSTVTGPAFSHIGLPNYEYTFKGWNPEITKVTKDVVYRAEFDSTLKVFSVSFLDFNDSLIGDVQKVEYGMSAEAPEAPKVEGYTFKGWDKKFGYVVKDLEVKALYDTAVYMVSFRDYNDGLIGDVQEVKYGKSAVAPEAPRIEGYTFKGWDKEFDAIKSDLNVNAVYEINTYELTYLYDADSILDVIDVEFGAKLELKEPIEKPATNEFVYTFNKWVTEDGSEAPLTMPASDLTLKAVFDSTLKVYSVVFLNHEGDTLGTYNLPYGSTVTGPAFSHIGLPNYEYTFKGWNPEITAVTENVVYRAEFDSTLKVFSVSFLDFNDSLIGGVQKVEYGMSAEAPETPEVEGFSFKGWDKKFGYVVKDLEVKALYDTIKYMVTFRDYKDSILHQKEYPYHFDMAIANNMACERKPSKDYVYTFNRWSEPLGLLTRNMDVKAVYDSIYVGISSSSSSVEVSSSSSVPEYSSSSVKLEIASKIDVSGSAVRLNFKAEGVDENTWANLIVKGKSGVIVDTTLDINAIESGVFEMFPAPAGKFEVELLLSREGDFVIDTSSFEVKSRIETARNSWQMVSVAAIDKSMLKNDDISLYWWDEENPIGDYWQYRAYAGENFESTRGFWYGTLDGTSIDPVEPASDVHAEIVWELDSLYSGWNLVSNPYGWFVSLEGKADNGVKVEFWRWNSESSEYEIPDVLGPYEAVWAKVKKSTSYRISSAPVYETLSLASAGKKSLRKGIARKASADSWTLGVALSDENGKSDSWNMLGVGVADVMDKAPAGMGNRVSLAIRESERGKKLAKSIKPASESYEWLLDVSASSARDGKISFEGVAELNALGYSLYVTTDGNTREIGAGESVPVALKKSSQKVAVRVAASGATIAAATMKGFTVTQNVGLLQVGFTAPDALAGSRGHYALVGVDGRKVAGGNFTAMAGSNVLNMAAPKSGVYFMQVKVGSQKMNAKVLVK